MNGRTVFAIVFLLAITASASAQTSTEELKRMSLEELLNVEIITVSRVPEQTTLVPAAVFVITQDDIRRSGATSIPEALRLAPGVQVARINGGTWAIGMRGFADRLARSVLVMIDGRAVYSPLFAGTYWETQDTLLADIDRIEVIRGPGGTLWGANAVNGIINIITKEVKDTQGLLVSAAGGTEDRGFGAVRYGGTRGAMRYRTYLQGVDRAPAFHADGNTYDRWRAGQGGFRTDWTLANQRALTVQGDAYYGELGERPSVALYTPPSTRSSNVDAPLSGGNVLARYQGTAGASTDFQLQTYYARTNRQEIPVEETRDTFDVDFQQTLRRWPRHGLTWGAGYRVSSGRITATPPTAFTPETRTDNLYSAFLQDEIAVVPDRWRLTLGTKIEHNDYSGFEFQPTARLLWTLDASNTIFWAATRAVRTPSRVETDYTTTSLVSAAPTPTFVRLMPNPSFAPEQLVAYEMGYRARPTSQLYVTFSGFYNDLDHLLSTELLTPFVETSPAPARVILPVDFGNGLHGNSYGAEVTADARATTWWRLTANYSYLHTAVSRNQGGRDVASEARDEGLSPRHQLEAASSIDVRGGWSFDWLVRYISELQSGPIPAYATSNIRVGYHLAPALEFSVVGQNLHHDHHPEWPSGAGGNVEIERSIYAGVTWKR